MSIATTERDETTTETAAAPPEPADTQAIVRGSVAASIGFGLSARNWEEGFKIAGVLAKSNLVPKGYQGHPEDIVVAMQLGAELGLPPMQALQSIAVINGRPGVYGDGFLGVIMSKPTYHGHSEYYLVAGERRDFLTTGDLEQDSTTAVSAFWRKGVPSPFTATFSVGDAKKAKLWGKAGPWQEYPGRMLKLRARGFAGRDGFAAELRGMKTVEELRDTPTDESGGGAPIDTTPPAEPIRRSEKAAAIEASSTPAPVEGEVMTTELPDAAAPRQESPATPAAGSPKAAGQRSVGASATPAAAKKDPKQTAPAVKTPNMVVDDTALVAPKGIDPFYEIKAHVKEDGRAPLGMTFRTADKALYETVSSCEGSETKFNITWHASKTADGTTCKVIDAIEAAN